MAELNERQRDLYQLLEATDGVATIGDIVSALWCRYPRFNEHCSKANSPALRLLRKDVNALNRSTTPKAVVSVVENGDMVGYKLANGKDTLKAAEKMARDGIRKLMRAKALRSKVETQSNELFEDTEWSNILALFQEEGQEDA